jgi:hypothetical protein
MSQQILRRMIHPETKVIDAKKGIVEYIASDESLDSYREVIRANGWRFNRFEKNAPFVDSHDYSTIEKLVGQVVDFAVVGKKLVETVQWAVDVADNKLAQLGWAMTEAGYLKAVSVGFIPVKAVSKWDVQDASKRGEWLAQLKELGLTEEQAPSRIFVEQEQYELSACIIGANMNAVAKGYKAGVLDDSALEMICLERAKRENARAADGAAAAAQARQQTLADLFRRFEQALKSN